MIISCPSLRLLTGRPSYFTHVSLIELITVLSLKNIFLPVNHLRVGINILISFFFKTISGLVTALLWLSLRRGCPSQFCWGWQRSRSGRGCRAPHAQKYLSSRSERRTARPGSRSGTSGPAAR